MYKLVNVNNSNWSLTARPSVGPLEDNSVTTSLCPQDEGDGLSPDSGPEPLHDLRLDPCHDVTIAKGVPHDRVGRGVEAIRSIWKILNNLSLRQRELRPVPDDAHSPLDLPLSLSFLCHQLLHVRVS